MKMKRRKYVMSVNVTALYVGIDDEDDEKMHLYEALLRAENAANSIITGAISSCKRCSIRLHFSDVEPSNE